MTINQFIRQFVYGCTKYRFEIYENIGLEEKAHDFSIDYHSEDADAPIKINEYLDFCDKATFDHINVDEDGYLRICGYYEQEEGDTNN